MISDLQYFTHGRKCKTTNKQSTFGKWMCSSDNRDVSVTYQFVSREMKKVDPEKCKVHTTTGLGKFEKSFSKICATWKPGFDVELDEPKMVCE